MVSFKTARNNKGYTLEELALKTNNGTGTIINYERDLSFIENAQLINIYNICEELEIDIEDLFDMDAINKDIGAQMDKYYADNSIKVNLKAAYKRNYLCLKKWEERNMISSEENTVLLSKLSDIKNRYLSFKEMDESTMRDYLMENKKCMAPFYMKKYTKGARKLRYYKYITDISAEQLASVLDVKSNMLYNYINGTRDINTISVGYAIKLAACFKIKAKDLLEI